MALSLESSRHIPCAVRKWQDGTWNVPATQRGKPVPLADAVSLTNARSQDFESWHPWCFEQLLGELHRRLLAHAEERAA